MIHQYNPKEYTLICELFDACNMHCEFCMNNRSKPDLSIDANYILETLPKAIETEIVPILKERQATQLLFNLYGGELFMPSVIEQGYLDIYRELAAKVKSLVDPTCKVYVNFVSNGTFLGYENEVRKLLDDLNTSITISYDTVGRFRTSKSRELVEQVIKNMKDKISTISFTTTRPNVLKTIEEDTFAKFRDLKIDLSYYLPMNNDNAKLMPTDEDMCKFYDYILDNGYWNVKEIRAIIYGLKDPDREMYGYCDRAVIALRKDNKTQFNHACCYDMVRNGYEESLEDYFGNLTEKIQNPNLHYKCLLGREIRGCNYCENNLICPKICHLAIMWKGTKFGYECPLHHAISRLKLEKELLDEAWNCVRGDLR